MSFFEWAPRLPTVPIPKPGYSFLISLIHITGFSLGLDDMEGDLSPPPYGGGQVQGDKAVIGGDGWGGTYTLWGDPYFE